MRILDRSSHFHAFHAKSDLSVDRVDQAMRSTGHASSYQAQCSAVICWFSTAVIEEMKAEKEISECILLLYEMEKHLEE